MKYLISALFFLFISNPSYSTPLSSSWTLTNSSSTGSVVLMPLKSNTIVHFTFEYSRNCAPLFSYTEIKGGSYGVPISQTRLKNTLFAIIIDNQTTRWHSAKTTYTNGYEVALGFERDTFHSLFPAKKLGVINEQGNIFMFPKANLNEKLNEAIEICKKKVLG